MIIEAGGYRHATRLGDLRLDRRLDAAQLEILVRAIEGQDIDWKRATAVDLSEGGARWTFIEKP